ncbi:MAG TPA: OmpH family outer membrane protein [Limnochordia bacterium]|nr:OmpH family outer membrane protein [Limnochordia bacterium]
MSFLRTRPWLATLALTAAGLVTAASAFAAPPTIASADALALIEADPAFGYVNAQAKHLQSVLSAIGSDQSLGQQQQQQAQAHFQQELAQVQQSLWHDIDYAAAQVAQAEKFDIVAVRQSLYYSDHDPVDLTQKIADYLKKEYGDQKDPQPLHPDALPAAGGGTLDGVAMVSINDAIMSDPLAQKLQSDLMGSDQDAQQKAVQKLRDRFNQALQSVAKAQKLHAVVEQQLGILYAGGDTQGDVTPDVQKALLAMK